MFSTKYTQLEVKTSDGEKTVIYDVNSKQLFFDILVFVVVIGMISIAAWRIPIEFIKARKKNKRSGFLNRKVSYEKKNLNDPRTSAERSTVTPMTDRSFSATNGALYRHKEIKGLIYFLFHFLASRL